MKVPQLQIRFPCKQNLEKFRPFPIFFRPYLSQIAPQEYLERINRFVSFLDPGNVKIATAMKKYGLRILQLIADKTRIPRPTVHARVSRLEKEGLLRTWIHPNYAKLGLVRAMVLLTTKPGRELLAPEALRIPGYWLRLIRCMVEGNCYYSTHAIPFGKRLDFEQYLEKIVASGIATKYRVLWLGEAISPLPDFSYYDAMKKTWTFDWPRWLQELAVKPLHTQRKETQLGGGFDKKELIILKELEKDGGADLTQLAGCVDMTVPAGVLGGFTFVMLDPMTIRAQTFSYEFYEDNIGWQYDNLEYFEQLRKVSAAFDKEEDIQVTFQSSPVMSFQ